MWTNGTLSWVPAKWHAAGLVVLLLFLLNLLLVASAVLREHTVTLVAVRDIDQDLITRLLEAQNVGSDSGASIMAIQRAFDRLKNETARPKFGLVLFREGKQAAANFETEPDLDEAKADFLSRSGSKNPHWELRRIPGRERMSLLIARWELQYETEYTWQGLLAPAKQLLDSENQDVTHDVVGDKAGGPMLYSGLIVLAIGFFSLVVLWSRDEKYATDIATLEAKATDAEMQRERLASEVAEGKSSLERDRKTLSDERAHTEKTKNELKAREEELSAREKQSEENLSGFRKKVADDLVALESLEKQQSGKEAGLNTRESQLQSKEVQLRQREEEVARNETELDKQRRKKRGGDVVSGVWEPLFQWHPEARTAANDLYQSGSRAERRFLTRLLASMVEHGAHSLVVDKYESSKILVHNRGNEAVKLVCSAEVPPKVLSVSPLDGEHKMAHYVAKMEARYAALQRRPAVG